MDKRIVVITGGAGDIGLAMARGYAEAGDTVVILDLHQAAIDNVVSLLALEGFSVDGFACDVTREKQVSALINTIQERHGRIDILINNAGLQYIAPIESFPIDKFRQLIDLMLVAPFIATRYVLPFMQRQKFGRIINMASVNGLIGFAGKSAYNSAKHGVIGLTKVTALEGAPFNITANAICPGYVNTSLVRNQLAQLAQNRGVTESKVLEEVIFPLVPQKRLLDPEEVTGYALYLSCEKAGGITGQAVVIDGGYTVQ